MVEFRDKFVAYIDVLGFTQLVEESESGRGRSLPQILELLRCLGNGKERDRFNQHGPKCCPTAPCIDKNLDFRVTQISDCAVISAEISPAGVINVISHCWEAAIELLSRGILCRGYIGRGSIFHTDVQFIGTGYRDAYLSERNVSVFGEKVNDRGTPFIEVGGKVTSYVATQSNKCVKEMFDRMTKRDGVISAVFPFQSLEHSFVVAGLDHRPDFEKDIASNQNLRIFINRLKERIREFVDPSNERAMMKVDHYLAALDAQIENCNETDRVIRLFSSG